MEVEDWDSGEVVAIRLDPEKSAVEFAEGLYKQVGQGRGQGASRAAATADERGGGAPGRAAGIHPHVATTRQQQDALRRRLAACHPARGCAHQLADPVPWAPPPRLQARKQRRAAEQVAPLLAAARAELDYLAEVELMLQQAEGGGHLAALQEVQASAAAHPRASAGGLSCGGCGAGKRVHQTCRLPTPCRLVSPLPLMLACRPTS